MRAVFADSFYFFALANDRDPANVKARAFVQTYTGRLFTTGWVLTEVADGWSKAAWRGQFEILIAELRSNPSVVLVPFSDELFEDGFTLFKNRPDIDWSQTDCISFVVMQREGLREALTGDRQFEQAGFTALLK